ncbi:MAG: hypothetical protein ACRENE_00505 [Polyangiaceae bacterium]
MLLSRVQASACRVVFGAAVVTAVTGCGSSSSRNATVSDGGADAGASGLVDPGTSPWVLVPADQVRDVCKLDPAALAAAEKAFDVPWAIVRYGRLCYQHKAIGFTPAEAWSTTKTLGAVAVGAVAYETRGLPSTGRKTGPLADTDRVDQWLDAFTYNKDAQVAHVMAMVAASPSLALGQRTMTYDTIGTTQINSLSDIANAAIAQAPSMLGANLEDFTQKFVFEPLGMTHSTWSNGAATKTFAYSWTTDVLDMARIGLLLMNGGVWSGRRVVDADWVYRMTHPSFEDANTGYGYLTWLNASSNWTLGGIPGAMVTPDANGRFQGAYSPGPCAPVSLYKTHPHGLSDSPDCNYAAPYICAQTYDVGVWQAVGLAGQVIQGHPGLDLVIVARQVTPSGTGPDAPKMVWDALKGAVIAADPRFGGDESGFCAAYGANAYAPDLTR